jgi:pimeloyl-ACP methyl ester carboxylesterase
LRTGTSESFFFGSERALFGCYQAASRGTRGAALLCPPLGHEYLSSHRAFRQLAVRLARAGFASLRFDYSGTGDSAGDPRDDSLLRWLEDVRRAERSLEERARATTHLVGLRLGATFALMRAAAGGPTRDLVLWDPVVRGEDYIAELRTLQDELVESTGRPAENELREALGFPLPRGLVESLSRIDVGAIDRKPAERILLVDTRQSSVVSELAQRLAGLGVSVRHEQSDAAPIWSEEADQVVVPNETLARIVRFMKADA